MKVRDERKITSMEMWLWRRMLRISWMEERTDNSILQELEIKRELLGHVRKRKLTYYGHLCRDHGCQITKTAVEGYVERRRRRGRPRKQYNRQHQTVDTSNDITVRTGCRRSQPLETARRSSDGGRRLYVICRKEEEVQHMHVLSLPENGDHGHTPE